MKFMEILAAALYLGIVFAGITWYTQWQMTKITFDDVLYNIGHRNKDQANIFKNVLEPTCFQQISVEDSEMYHFGEEFQKLAGKSLEWILMELVVYVFFLCTMIVIMFKSRF